MVDNNSGLNERIAAQVRELRAARGFSLDVLSAKSGISRSMISLIERGESSPTAVVLEKLAAGLDVTLASLFDPAGSQAAAASPVVRREAQPEWKDPASGYVRRNVSPPGIPQPIQIVEVAFPGRARVAFETGNRGALVYQQIWIFEGTIDITWGDELFHLRPGDCMAMQLDRPVLFHNPSSKPARYAVVLSSSNSPKR